MVYLLKRPDGPEFLLMDTTNKTACGWFSTLDEALTRTDQEGYSTWDHPVTPTAKYYTFNGKYLCLMEASTKAELKALHPEYFI